MTRRMAVRCLRCDAYCYEDVGQWLRFRALCPDCVAKGYTLELYTNDAFASPNRKWFVGLRHGDKWVEAHKSRN